MTKIFFFPNIIFKAHLLILVFKILQKFSKVGFKFVCSNFEIRYHNTINIINLQLYN